MQRMLAATAAMALLFSTAALADEIEDRRAIMKQNGASIGVLVKMSKGEVEFDEQEARAALVTIREGTEGFTDLFPEGTETGGDTIASPKIWEDMDGFKAEMAALHADLDTLIAAPPMAVDELGPVIGTVGGHCQSCHQEYRLQRN